MRSDSVAAISASSSRPAALRIRGAAVERRREADLRLLFAEERDGFIHQRERLRIVAHAELRHRQAARGHHGFFAARMPAQQRVRAQQVVERLVGIAVAEIEPAAIAQHAAERERPIANRIDDARELDVAASMPPTLVLTTARTVRMRTARSDMSPAGSSARPASACVMLWRLKPSWREASAAMACSAARRVGGMSAAVEMSVGELRQGGGRIAECEIFDRGEIAGLRADTGCICRLQHTGRQCQQAADAQPDLPGVRANHGA